MVEFFNESLAFLALISSFYVCVRLILIISIFIVHTEYLWGNSNCLFLFANNENNSNFIASM